MESNAYTAAKAATYDHEPEHALPDGEAKAWLTEMSSIADDGALTGEVLDVGAGTGLLMLALKQAGMKVVGLEPSAAMIQRGVSRQSGLTRGDFVLGRADEGDRFQSSRFDWMVSRQVLCHLATPEKSFAAWHRWLKPGGHLLLVDGLWSRASWSEQELALQPFAALIDPAPVAAALEKAGFSVIKAGSFTTANAARAMHWASSVERYVVIAAR